METCPFCGAAIFQERKRDDGTKFIVYTCLSSNDGRRGKPCCERQLAQQADEIDNLEAIVDNLKDEITDKDFTIGGQAALIERAEEVVKALLDDKELETISYMSTNCGRDYYFCSLCGSEAATERLITHKDDCLYLQLVALIPDLEAARRKVG